jgi:hypothetical protein
MALIYQSEKLLTPQTFFLGQLEKTPKNHQPMRAQCQSDDTGEGRTMLYMLGVFRGLPNHLGASAQLSHADIAAGSALRTSLWQC